MTFLLLRYYYAITVLSLSFVKNEDAALTIYARKINAAANGARVSTVSVRLTVKSVTLKGSTFSSVTQEVTIVRSRVRPVIMIDQNFKVQ